jgi:hypothetical protein
MEKDALQEQNRNQYVRYTTKGNGTQSLPTSANVNPVGQERIAEKRIPYLVQLWKIAVDTVYVWNFQESLRNVGVPLVFPVKYAMNLALPKAASTTSIWTNANLARDVMRTTSCSLERNALVKLRLTIRVLQSKSANTENL